MPSERVQRQIDRLLDDAEGASEQRDWALMLNRAEAVLAIDSANNDALAFAAIAKKSLEGSEQGADGDARQDETREVAVEARELPDSFVDSRYQVKDFLGEGGRKQVYRAHDTRLNRDVAFAVIKTEGLDANGRQRIQREAEAMGRLSGHPHIVTIYDVGETDVPGETGGQPYIVSEYMAGGDV